MQVMEASDTSQQTATGSEMGSQVTIAIHHPLSEYAEVRVLRVARRAIRQSYRENVILHRGQVITSEAQLAVIFGQREGWTRFQPRTLSTFSKRLTNTKKQQQPGTARTGPLWLALTSTSQMARLIMLYC